MSKRVTFIHASDLHLGGAVPRVARAFVQMGEPPAQRHPGIVRPHGRRGHCPRRGLRGGVGRHIRLRAPLVRRLSALLRRVGTPRRGGHSGVPDHGQPRSVHLVAARLLLAAAQRHHAAGRPTRLRAGGARRPTAVPDRRPRLLQPNVADGRVHRRRRHARSGRAGASRPASARCGSPVRSGPAAHRPQPRSGESPGRPPPSSCTRAWTTGRLGTST